MAIRSSPKEVVACLSGKSYGGEVNVVCPNCNSDYTHVHHVGTLMGTDDHEATAAYQGTDPSGVSAERRSALEIVFACENCPKLFAVVFQQHKGVSTIQIHDEVSKR